MTTIKELKNMIVDLKVQLMISNIPKGHCPYAYSGAVEKPDEDNNCDDCTGCRKRFFKGYEEKVREWVETI